MFRVHSGCRRRNSKVVSITGNANLDMIRVWSMTCVLLMHTPKNPWSAIPVFGWVVNCFIVASNSHFYMLSGQMNLAKTFSSKEDYREYYVKRLVSIVFPYLLVTMAMTLWNMVLDGQALGVKSYIKHMYMDLMVDNGTIHFCPSGQSMGCSDPWAAGRPRFAYMHAEACL